MIQVPTKNILKMKNFVRYYKVNVVNKIKPKNQNQRIVNIKRLRILIVQKMENYAGIIMMMEIVLRIILRKIFHDLQLTLNLP